MNQMNNLDAGTVVILLMSFFICCNDVTLKFGRLIMMNIYWKRFPRKDCDSAELEAELKLRW